MTNRLSRAGAGTVQLRSGHLIADPVVMVPTRLTSAATGLRTLTAAFAGCISPGPNAWRILGFLAPRVNGLSTGFDYFRRP